MKGKKQHFSKRKSTKHKCRLKGRKKKNKDNNIDGKMDAYESNSDMEVICDNNDYFTLTSNLLESSPEDDRNADDEGIDAMATEDNSLHSAVLQISDIIKKGYGTPKKPYYNRRKSLNSLYRQKRVCISNIASFDDLDHGMDVSNNPSIDKECSLSDDSGCSSWKSDIDNDNDGKENYAKDRSDRFIVSSVHFSEEILRTYQDHLGPISTCKATEWKLKTENIRYYGLCTKFTFECQNCWKKDVIFSEANCEEHLMDINTAAVAGSLASGIGHTQLQQILASLAIHCMTDKMYTRKQSNICQETFNKATKQSMQDVIAEEIRLAKENGDVTKEGIPFITVIIDGSWLKRTYGTHWNSCSGMAAIIGARTEKVLYFGIRNKYCLTCARAANLQLPTKKHDCHKNWDSSQPSTGMESDIILQGFRESIKDEVNKVIYETVIMDNDSSLYKAIRDSNIYSQYDIVPRRILCSVHLMKNMCKNLRKAADSNQTTQKGKRGIGAARELVKKNVETMRLKVKEVIDRRVKEKCDWKMKKENLRYDILNIPSHVFGEHRMCAQRGDRCIQARKKNLVPYLKSFGLYDKVDKVFRDLSCHSESLLHQKSTNIVELLNSLICRALGGKRINWGLKSQYKTRVTSQVLQFNTGSVMSEFHKIENKIIPAVLQAVEDKRRAKALETKNRRSRYGVVKGGRKKPSFDNEAGKFYGKKHQDVDMSEEDMKLQSELSMNDLKEYQENRVKIQEDTVDKSSSHLWASLQKKMLHSEHFQMACSWKPSTSCAAKVKKILYPSINLKPEVQIYTTDQENVMKDKIAKIEKCVVTNCGVFIDEEYPFLGTSPSALLAEDGLLQIVCPIDVADFPVKAAIEKKSELKKMFVKGSLDVLSTKSEIYYNIQGALHITQKQYCLLVISTKVDEKCIKVEIDHEFWKRNMENQLKIFFQECLLPEMVNSRYNRNMPIRNPPQTCTILAEREKKNKEKDNLNEKKTLKRKRENSLPVEEEDDDCQYVSSYVIDSRSEISNEWFREFANNRIIRYHHVRLILGSPYQWLDDDCLDLLVRIFNTKPDCPFEIQSVMYMERPDIVQPVRRSAAQIIGGNCTNHWRTAQLDYETKQIYIYDSQFGTDKVLSAAEIKYLRARFGDRFEENNIIFKPMKVYQQDASSCGLFASAYAISLYFGEDPANIAYATQAMILRHHFREIIVSNEIHRFPTTP